ncbi:hypothetical protein [Saccharopolyspora hattusasensis]|uniref:hypothetical protein n=1 Tax=Saccharopolyspora hattusasensis TaxID=1128679 RepID=UPI003D987A0D
MSNTGILKGVRCPECVSETAFIIQMRMNVVMLVGSPSIPMATFAATPVADLMRYHQFGRPEATLSGVVCGHCFDVFDDLVVRHASAGHVRACFEAGEEERWQMEGELAADRAVERHFEDRGYWEARAQENYEMSRGIWPY